jgi:hypothetical protein
MDSGCLFETRSGYIRSRPLLEELRDCGLMMCIASRNTEDSPALAGTVGRCKWRLLLMARRILPKAGP